MAIMSEFAAVTVLVISLASVVVQAVQPDYCSLPAETGPCRAAFQRYHFNTTTGECERFIYGGCQGNENNFPSEMRCKADCVCSLDEDSGNRCLGRPSRKFYYDVSSGQCDSFRYLGCGGNENRFSRRSACEGTCSTSFCFLPSETGPCRASFKRYFYNKTTDTCEEFTYGGCDGNLNRFESKLECNQRCTFRIGFQERLYGFGSGGARRNGNVRRGRSPIRNPRSSRGYGFINHEVTAEDCQLPPITGLCKAYIPSYYYDVSNGTCERFIYGGCGGNNNRFSTKDECLKSCQAIAPKRPPFCLLPAKPGPCKAYMPSYFYNPSSGICEEFVYGGCQGNKNRFQTEAECVKTCNAISAEDLRVCNLPPETGPCRGYFLKYGYNATTGMCSEFVYGGCQGNDNRFDSADECVKRCGGVPSIKPPACLQPVQPGPCRGYFPSYHYNATSQACDQFVYGGCQGNDNRFETEAECSALCL